MKAHVLLLGLIFGLWAVPYGTAHSSLQNTNPRQSRERQKPVVPQSPNAETGRSTGRSQVPIPHPVSFRDVPGRGLLVRAWVNSAGPFNFAVDTGAGATLLSPQVVSEAHVAIKHDRGSMISGLSGVTTSTREAGVSRLAIGDNENFLPAKGLVIVTNGLPSGVDGVLDPTEAFAPLGYVIDLPRSELEAFDPHISPVQLSEQPEDGAVVQWAREGHGRRPFVLLNSGERALLDTGSNLGFAVREGRAPDQNRSGYVIHDVGGGSVEARRVAPATIGIGSLMLRRIPTDVVYGAEADAPVLLGLSALRPFRIRFDPVHHLIEIAPGASRRRT